MEGRVPSPGVVEGTAAWGHAAFTPQPPDVVYSITRGFSWFGDGAPC